MTMNNNKMKYLTTLIIGKKLISECIGEHVMLASSLHHATFSPIAGEFHLYFFAPANVMLYLKHQLLH